MADQNFMNPIDVSRLGQINATGDANAMFLKVFSGEVLQTFEEANVMMPLHTVRTIASGKTAQFPVMGTAAAKYHTTGESIMGSFVDDPSGTAGVAEAGEGKYLNRIKHAERTISIDGTLVSSAFIADIDEAKNHYDVRAAYTTQIGRELAYPSDRALILLLLLVPAMKPTASAALRHDSSVKTSLVMVVLVATPLLNSSRPSPLLLRRWMRRTCLLKVVMSSLLLLSITSWCPLVMMLLTETSVVWDLLLRVKLLRLRVFAS